LTRSTARAVIGGTNGEGRGPAFQVELRQADYLELLKQAKRQSRVSARLIAAVEHERKRDAYLFAGYVTDGLSLRGVALVHAPEALPAIDRALKRAREG
jgi:hypothetical protein